MADFDFIPFDGRQDLIEFSDGSSGESFYWGADGDEYYNAKGEKLKGALQKFGKGLGKGVKGLGKGLKKVGQAIVKAEKWVVAKSKKLVKGAKKGKKGDKPKGKELVQQKDKSGKETFTETLKPATADTPADKVVTIEGQKLSAVDVPADKPIVVSTDPTTGKKVVGVEYKPEETTAIEGADGNLSYYPTNKVTTDSSMSTTTKIAIAVGGVAVLGVIVYLIAKKKK
jgi:hypothetical protein